LKPVPWATAKFALTVAKANRMSNVAIVFGIITKSSEKRSHRWNARGLGAAFELNEWLLDGKEHPKGADFVNGDT
jgi:hypothetical protein